MIITLLTDFGLQDAYVASMKGVILQRSPGAQIIDISHAVRPQAIEQAAFLLWTSYRHFPSSTIHTVVVDPGVGSRRKAIVCRTDEYLFVGPDNGVFSWIIDRDGGEARTIEAAELRRAEVSNTFHGRDIFAPAAGALASGFDFAEVGGRTATVSLPGPDATEGPDGIEARILHVDRFGNCFTNISRDTLGGRRVEGLSIHGEVVSRAQSFYSEATDASPFLYWGSTGYLEVAVNRASAAERLGASVGTQVSVSLR